MNNLEWIRTADKKELAEFLDRLIDTPCAFCKYGNSHGCDGSCPSVSIEDWLDERHHEGTVQRKG